MPRIRRVRASKLTLKDSVPVDFGGVSFMSYNVSDANANLVLIDFPVGGAIDVPVLLGALSATDFGYFNAQTFPTIAMEDIDGDGAIYMSHSADDIGIIGVKGATTEIQIVATTLTFTGAVGFAGAQVITGDFSVDGALGIIDGSTSVRLISAGFTSLESPSNRLGLNATEYVEFVTTVTTGATAINHTGTDPIVTWTANGFNFIGDMIITSVLKGLDIDVTTAGADANYFGIDNDVIQGAVAVGAYLSRGNLIGAANSVSAIGNIDATYGTYSPSYLVMAADTEANQLYGGIFMSNVEGPFTLDIHDGVVGAQLTLEIAADVVDVTRGAGTGIVAGAFIWANVLKAITAPVYGAYIKCTNHCDYGQTIAVESNNISAGMQILTKDSAVLPIGLQIISVSGSITHAFGFSAAGTAPVVASATGAGDAAEGSIAIDVDGSTKYLQYFAATA